jgi:phage terminase small subunit
MQARFVQEYLIDLDQGKAARRAGYASKSADRQATRMMRHPAIKAAIDEARGEIKTRNNLTQDDVVQGLLKEAKFAGDGASHSARVQAWGHLGKYLGMFVDKVKTGPMSLTDMIDLTLLSDDELNLLQAVIRRADRSGAATPDA